MLTWPGRYRRLHDLQRLDPRSDFHQIHRATALYEFPFDTRLGLLLGFWRTFAVPSIAAVLAATGQTTHHTRKRADDTGILMFELIDHGLEHPRGRAVIRRLNQLHRALPVGNDDYLYVLGTFIFVPARWIDRNGWRPLCCHERTASFHFYSELGRRMGIREIPASYEDYSAFFDEFERTRFGYTGDAAALLEATKGLIAKLPAPLIRIGQAAVDAVLDAPLRAATGVAEPSPLTNGAVRVGLGLRRWLLRRCPPRPRSRFAGGISAGSYPDGYEISEVGAEPSQDPARQRP